MTTLTVIPGRSAGESPEPMNATPTGFCGRDDSTADKRTMSMGSGFMPLACPGMTAECIR
jgi:hypothetical protein